MLKIKKFLTDRGPISVAVSVVLSVLLVVGIVEAATTISANINTAGTLTVTGTSALTGAVTATAGITSGANIVSDTTSTDSLGLTGTRWASTFSNNFTGNTITLDGLTGVNILTITDNMADALSIVHGGTDFMAFSTANSAEILTIIPYTEIKGNFVVNGFATTTAATGNFATEGTLTAVGNSVLASADIGGGYTAGTGSGLKIDATGKLQLNGALEFNGYATTTASNGNFETAGTLTAIGNSVLTSATIGGGYGSTGLTIDADGKLQFNGNLEVNGYATTTASTGAIATEGSLTIGGGTAISNHLSVATSLDFPVIAANSCELRTITVTGAAGGDTVALGMHHNIMNASTTLTVTGWVSASDTVTVRLCQVAALGTSDFVAADCRADVWKH